MNKKQIIEAAKALSIDEITYLQMELAKLKKVKIDSRERLSRIVKTHSIMMERKYTGYRRNDIHPVCYT
jgi:hypothetical protein